jgi:RNA polymerase sigma-70 factor (ECF subfamily)
MAAAERVFRAHEPYHRMAVRRKLPSRLRAKFDSVDVVHSMWAHMLRGFRDAGWRFADADRPRARLPSFRPRNPRPCERALVS